MKNFIFVTDFLPTEITGGAELTFEAIKNAAPDSVNVSYIKSETITPNTWLKENVHWVLGNYTRISKESLDALCALAQQKKIEYSVVEFDYKYCTVRNEKVHNFQLFKTGAFGFCNCAQSITGMYTKTIFGLASKVHFMSQEQMDLILKRMPELNQNKDNMRVQWSTWSKEDLEYIENLSFPRMNNGHNNKFAIQKSSNWLKGTDAAIEYATSNNLEYELLDSMEYRKFLEVLRTYRGFIFLPNAYDTCPRVVIEAKLLGLEYVINNNVQIKKELLGTTREEILDRLYLSPRNFWKSYQL